jgi:hypothetical protein
MPTTPSSPTRRPFRSTRACCSGAALRGARGVCAAGPQCRRLLALLVSDPPLPYVRIAEVLDVPVGSLGPTRARCLEKLRRSEPLAAFLDGARR